eukprot:GAHX01000998.1.p1 GENE.GAHX01000998.1~~GAHX01000998.1.p1  ORF type:complete len:205 (+),score=21.51 GAHX01000998.1:126-740(+)
MGLDDLKLAIGRFLKLEGVCQICTSNSHETDNRTNSTLTTTYDSFTVNNQTIDDLGHISSEHRDLFENLISVNPFTTSQEDECNESIIIHSETTHERNNGDLDDTDSDINFMNDYFENIDENQPRQHGSCLNSEIVEFVKIKRSFSNNAGFWQVFQGTFKNLYTCFRKINTMMFSNSEIERFFSRAKILTNWHRNRTSVDMLRR